jgi:hypothetical protein
LNSRQQYYGRGLIGCTFAAAAAVLIPLLIIKMIRAYLFTNSPSKTKNFPGDEKGREWDGFC